MLSVRSSDRNASGTIGQPIPVVGYSVMSTMSKGSGPSDGVASRVGL